MLTVVRRPCSSAFVLLTVGLVVAGFSCAADQVGAAAADARFDTTVGRLETMVYRQPRLGTAFDMWYRTYAQADRLPELIDAVGQRTRQSPNDPAAFLVWGMLCQRTGQDKNQAEAAYRTAVKLAPNDYYARFLQGSLLAQKGRLREAAQALRESIDLSPPPADYLSIARQLGQLYLRTGQTAAATETWSAVAERFPGDVGVLVQLAKLLSQEKQFDAAIRSWQKVEQNAQDDATQRLEARVEIAQLNLDAGRFEVALNQFDEALDQVRADSWRASDLRQRIETAILNREDAARLVAFWQKRQQRKPDDLDSALQLARALARAGQQDRAIQQYQRTLDRAPGNRDLRQGLIDALLRTGDYAAAVSQAEELAELFPQDPETFFQLGTLYSRSNSPRDLAESQRKAIAAWSRMAEVRPDDASLARRVAESCRNEIPTVGSDDGQPPPARFAPSTEMSEDSQRWLATAETFYREAMRRASDSPEYREQMGEFLLAAGRRKEATDTWAEMVTRDTAAQWHQLATVYARYGCFDEAVFAGANSIERDADNLSHIDGQIGWLLQAKAYEDAREMVARLRQLAGDPDWEERAVRRHVEVAAAAGRLEQEIRRLRQTVADGAATAESYWTLSLLLARSENPVGAALTMDRALALDRHDLRLVRSMADIARASGDVASTLTQMRRLVDLDRANRVTYLKQIVVLEVRQNRPREAKSAADLLVELAPADPEGYRLRADAQFRLNEKTAGIGQLRQAIEIAPGHLDTRRQLAQKLLEEGAHGQAIEQYWQCFDRSQALADKLLLVTAISDASATSARRQRLIEKLRSLRRQQDDPKSLTICLAHALTEADRFSDALDELSVLHSRDPRDRDVLRQIIGLAERSGDEATAIDFQERLTKFDGTQSNLRELARLYADSGDHEKAIAAWQRQLDSVREPAAATKIVDRQFLAGQLEQAWLLADAARIKFPSHWQFVYRTGIARVGLGEFEQAAALLEKVLAIPRASLDDPLPDRSTEMDPLSVSRARWPEELLEFEGARRAYARYHRLLDRVSNTGTARQPPIVQVVLADHLFEAQRDCAVVMFLLRNQSPRAGAWLERLMAEPAADVLRVRRVVLAAMAALEYGEGAELPRMLDKLPADDSLRHMVRLQVPAPRYSVSPALGRPELARWREPLHDSYGWVSQHRPELRPYLRLPYGMNLALLLDRPGATALVDHAIDESLELADLESLLPLVVQQTSGAVRRKFLKKAADRVQRVTTETLPERQLRLLLDVALRHAGDDFADDALVLAVLQIFDRYLARSQLGVTQVGQPLRYWQLSADFYLTVLMQQVRGAQQSLIERDDLSPQERSRMHNQIQTELMRVRQMRQAANPTSSQNGVWTDPLDFPNPNAHLDVRRFQVLKDLHGALTRFGKESLLTEQLEQRLVATGDPDRTGYVLAKSYALWWSGDQQKALTELEQACGERSDDAELRFLLARAFFHAGRLRDALKQVDQTLATWPFSVDRNRVVDLRRQIVLHWSTVAKVFDLEGHTGVVHSLAFSPDGQMLASASVDKTIRLWDVATGRFNSTRTGHTDMVLCVAFSPDGHTLASGGYDRVVRVWDADREETPAVLPGHTDAVRAVAFSPNGQTLATAGDDTVVRLWGIESGTLVHALSGHTQRVLTVAFSPDGQTLATGSADGTVRLWDVDQGQLRATLRGHGRTVTSVRFIAGAPMLASSGEDGRVILWTSSNEVLASIDTSSPVRSMAASPDGRTIVTGCHDCSVNLWDVATRSVRFNLRDQTRTEQPVVAYSPNGRLVASAGYDGTIRLWQADSETLGSPPSAASPTAVSP